MMDRPRSCCSRYSAVHLLHALAKLWPAFITTGMPGRSKSRRNCSAPRLSLLGRLSPANQCGLIG